jgi:hypothetical protein
MKRDAKAQQTATLLLLHMGGSVLYKAKPKKKAKVASPQAGLEELEQPGPSKRKGKVQGKPSPGEKMQETVQDGSRSKLFLDDVAAALESTMAAFGVGEPSKDLCMAMRVAISFALELCFTGSVTFSGRRTFTTWSSCRAAIKELSVFVHET